MKSCRHCCLPLPVYAAVRKRKNPTNESKYTHPMVMVMENLHGYRHDSTIEGRCGVMDGEIMFTVDGTERPIKGITSPTSEKTCGYQYGTTEGTIEIYRMKMADFRY